MGLMKKHNGRLASVWLPCFLLGILILWGVFMLVADPPSAESPLKWQAQQGHNCRNIISFCNLVTIKNIRYPDFQSCLGQHKNHERDTVFCEQGTLKFMFINRLVRRYIAQFKVFRAPTVQFLHHKLSLCTTSYVCGPAVQFVHHQFRLCTISSVCTPPVQFVHHQFRLCTTSSDCAPGVQFFAPSVQLLHQ